MSANQIVSKKRRKSPACYGLWEHQNLQQAVRAVFVQHYSKKRAAKTYGIPRSTLQRYIKACQADGGVQKKNAGRPTVLTEEQERELSGLIQDMDKRLYGLTPLSVRKIVYQYCELNSIPHEFNDDSKSAGKKWLRLFLARNTELSIRKPEGVSIQRALGYNQSKIKIFEDVLRKELFYEDGSRRIPVENIFNVDETGISVNHKPPKVIATKGKKSVAVITSAEKGKTVTAVCCMSAAGAYCPPFMIFPRKRFKPDLLDRGPIGASGVANPSGWINESLFTEWFDHFLNFFQPQHRTSPSLLIMDGHVSHTNNLKVINKARSNNVSLLVLPSHCTHKIQPLDVAVFKSLKFHYDRAVGNWLHAHAGRPVQESNVAELFADAWGKAATVSNAVSGFKKSRINPFRETSSDDEDFLGADVTDIPLESSMPLQQVNTTDAEIARPMSQMAVSSDSIPLVIQASDQQTENVVAMPETVSVELIPSTGLSQMAVSSDSIPLVIQASDQQTENVAVNKSFAELIPVPKTSRNTRSKRAVAHAKIITASPYKRKLEEGETERKRKIEAKKIRLEMKEGKKNDRPHPSRPKAKSTDKPKQNNKTGKMIGENEDTTPCLYCEIPYNESYVEWAQCPTCEMWVCYTCVHHLNLNKKGKLSFRCGAC